MKLASSTKQNQIGEKGCLTCYYSSHYYFTVEADQAVDTIGQYREGLMYLQSETLSLSSCGSLRKVYVNIYTMILD